jgi:allantoicase
MSQPTLDAAPDFVRENINMASSLLGATAVFANDEFFASKERLLSPVAPVFVFGKKDESRPGLFMDGWETRRRRSEGYDYCIIRLGFPGVVHGVDVDTSHFTGNFPPAASIDACRSASDVPPTDAIWVPLLPVTPLTGNSHHYLEVSNEQVFTHIRLNIFPDGGIARLRVYGRASIDWGEVDKSDLHELSALRLGGRAVAASDEHYGSPNNLLVPGSGDSPVDGWETRRRRVPGNEWAIIELGTAGQVEVIEVDTSHFRGNYPDRCSVQAANIEGGAAAGVITQSMFWRTILSDQKLEMNRIHVFADELSKIGPATHLRFNIIPDGGVMRFRAFGKIS